MRRGYVLLPLTRGVNAKIDPEMAEHLSQWNWCANPTKSGFYAQRKESGKTVYLHRFVAEADDGEVVDHINGDTLDNRQMNLRVTSQSENMRNVSSRRASASGFLGVYPRNGRFIARIKIDGRHEFIGTFDTAEQAAEAYDARAMEIDPHTRGLNKAA